MPKENTPRPDTGATPCERCNGARFIASDSEWPGPSEDPCPACMVRVCDYCEAAPAVCVGQYEDDVHSTFACSDCCDGPNGEHGCSPIAPKSGLEAAEPAGEPSL